jgi:tRNA (cytidine32/guanosine34-2'-O)-methyltransferase
MAPGATLIFKIFLSPLDPSAALLRSQLSAFFPGPQGPQRGEGAQPPAVTAFAADFADVQEFDDTRTDFEQPADDAVDASIPAPAPSAEAARSTWGSGYDGFGRPGGVWVRKPRSSRKGSGGEFSYAAVLLITLRLLLLHCMIVDIYFRGLHRLPQL